MAISRHEENRDWAELSDGCYLERPNLAKRDAATPWKTYIRLTQIEDSFRVSKHDLGLRPIYHHKHDRAKVHILVCFLALVMWRTLPQGMSGYALGDAARNLLDHMAKVWSLDIVLPTGAGTKIRLWTVSRPETHLTIPLARWRPTSVP